MAKKKAFFLQELKKVLNTHNTRTCIVPLLKKCLLYPTEAITGVEYPQRAGRERTTSKSFRFSKAGNVQNIF